jgi:hypothetical protein
MRIKIRKIKSSDLEWIKNVWEKRWGILLLQEEK